MSGTGESSESSRTLPRAELNPLLNPILASHMGRWAEVYFTSPPEKREEAVLELLRELEAEDSGKSSAAPVQAQESSDVANDVEKYFRETHGNGGSARSTVQPSVACQRCGHGNPMTHQFCGMCGASLQAVSAEAFRTDSPYGQHEGEMENHNSHAPMPAAEQALPEPYVSEPSEPTRESSSDPYDLSMLQGLRQREIADYEYEEPSSAKYRYYIGAALAILLAVLGYMAWHSGQTSQSSHQASAPPPPASTGNAPATQPAPPQATTSAPSVSPKAVTPAASPSTTNVAETPKPQKSGGSNQPAIGSVQNSAAATTAPVATAAAEPQFSSSSGADDLAMAQRFLNGTNGQARDPAQAEKLLWQAVKKHNGPATLQLADIYLKGDGIPKNCEQARILLDSATIRGLKGAGERLRNLQAFGCQ